jgi:hypothetical protein
MVFDRGLMSQKNLAMLEVSEGVKFISALDKSQIPTSPGVDLKQFSSLREKNIEAQIRSLTGFHKFEANVFFKDLGEIEGKRYVLSINTNLLREERKMRRKKLRQFNSFLKKFNEELKNAKRDRDYGVTNRKISEMLKKLKINRFYEDPVLKPITVKRKLKNGNTKSVSSFKVTLKRIDEAIAKAKLLDGLCVFISNHTERSGRGYKMKPEKILQAYRDKTEIEDAFKNMKSFLKLRPFFVNTEQHVRAVFTICVIAYYINKTLARKRKEIEGMDYLNSKELYDPFKDCKMVTLKDSQTNTTVKKLVPPSQETKKLLKKLGLLKLLKFNEKKAM